MIHQIKFFFGKAIFSNPRFLLALWGLAALLMGVHLYLLGPSSYNNYLIFKGVFFHTLNQTNLYIPYPEYFDTNHYGPIFSLLVAPFALLPDGVAVPLWNACIALILFYAIYTLPIAWWARVAILYICWHEMITAASNVQTNGLIAAFIILTYTAVSKGKEWQAALWIVLGTFIKLYGIVGLSFFFFSNHKVRLILAGVMWSVVLFVLPMLISSPQFIIQTYNDWWLSLSGKNASNAIALHQDISVMGMFRRITGHRELSNLFFLIPAILLFGLQYIKTAHYSDKRYQLMILASTLLFVVLFSSGSESSGYIIAMVGVGVWFVLQKRPFANWAIGLLVFVMLLTSFSPTDLFPAYIRNTYVLPYALKALPCFMVWLVLIYQIIRFDHLNMPITNSQSIES